MIVAANSAAEKGGKLFLCAVFPRCPILGKVLRPVGFFRQKRPVVQALRIHRFMIWLQRSRCWNRVTWFRTCRQSPPERRIDAIEPACAGFEQERLMQEMPVKAFCRYATAGEFGFEAGVRPHARGIVPPVPQNHVGACVVQQPINNSLRRPAFENKVRAKNPERR